MARTSGSRRNRQMPVPRVAKRHQPGDFRRVSQVLTGKNGNILVLACFPAWGRIARSDGFPFLKALVDRSRTFTLSTTSVGKARSGDFPADFSGRLPRKPILTIGRFAQPLPIPRMGTDHGIDAALPKNSLIHVAGPRRGFAADPGFRCACRRFRRGFRRGGNILVRSL